MTENEQWLADQRQEQLRHIEKIPFAKARLQECKGCEKYISTIMVCSVCYCFMPGKVHLKNSECPVGKWGPLNETEIY